MIRPVCSANIANTIAEKHDTNTDLEVKQMNIINDMPIGRKMACGFGIVLILMVILGVVAYSEVNKLTMYADNLQESMITARQQEKNYLLKNDVIALLYTRKP
jgi:hypothetical protein